MMTRIGIDARLTYYRQGGISQYTYGLLRHLSDLDRERQYVVIHSRKDKRDLATAPNQQRMTSWTPCHHPLERLAFGVETLPMRLDLLHSPDFIPPFNRALKSIITIHDLTFLHYPDYLTENSKRYYIDQIDAAADRADHILTDSESSRDDILNMLDVPTEKVTTTLLGIDSAHFKPASVEEIDRVRAAYMLPADYLLFVGTIEPRKNINGLVAAYRALLADLPDLPPLVLAGHRGWLADDILTGITDPGVKDRVLWLENVPYNDLPALYSAASVLCLPSFYEGFGFPPLEAMACGTPAVVSNRSSLVEIAGDVALQVNPDSMEAIAEGLRRVLTDSGLAGAMSQRGIPWAQSFTWARTAHETLAVYNRVLEG